MTFSILSQPIVNDYTIINDYKIRKNKNLWARMRAGFQLDHTETDRVKYFERMYTKNPKSFQRMMENAKPYLYFMLNELERHGLPTELALIPGVESTYNPLAKNPGDAYAGMWQFVPVTGNRFYMVQNNQIDQRRDIVKSTRAAFDYLMYLYSMFGQWDVAIGAYNWGEGGMYKAILKSGQDIGHVDFQKLPLRQITLDYVPKIIALANIIENPEKFGVTLDDNATDEPFFAITNLPYQMRVGDVQQKSETDTDIFSKLNGQYKSSDYLLDKTDNVLLPLPNLMRFYANTGIQIEYSAPVNEVAQPTIAPSQDASSTKSLDDLMLNLSKQNASAPPKQTIKAKAYANAKAHAKDNEPDEIDDLLNQLDNTQTKNKHKIKSNKIKYIVKHGDTVYSICRKFHANVAKVKKDNRLPGYNLVVGQELIIDTKK